MMTKIMTNYDTLMVETVPTNISTIKSIIVINVRFEI